VGRTRGCCRAAFSCRGPAPRQSLRWRGAGRGGGGRGEISNTLHILMYFNCAIDLTLGLILRIRWLVWSAEQSGVPPAASIASIIASSSVQQEKNSTWHGQAGGGVSEAVMLMMWLMDSYQLVCAR
jgi:hypothetical protein